MVVLNLKEFSTGCATLSLLMLLVMVVMMMMMAMNEVALLVRLFLAKTTKEVWFVLLVDVCL